MNIEIRKATAADLDAVASLYGDVCDYLADKPYNPGWRRDEYPTRDEAEMFLAQDALYAAFIDGKLVGSVSFSPEANGESDESLRFDGEQLDGEQHIHILAVHPEFMRKGVGSALLRFAEGEAAKQGTHALRLYVYDKNDVAIASYERNGYKFLRKEDIGLREFGLEWFCLYEKQL